MLHTKIWSLVSEFILHTKICNVRTRKYDISCPNLCYIQNVLCPNIRYTRIWDSFFLTKLILHTKMCYVEHLLRTNMRGVFSELMLHTKILYVRTYVTTKIWCLVGTFEMCNVRTYVTHESHLISSQSLNLGGRQGTTDDVATIPFHPSLSSAALRKSPNSIPVHYLMLSSHLFFCRPLLLATFTVPCRIVLAMPEDLEMWPYHLSFRFFTMVRRSSCTLIAFWILLRTSSFVTWSL